LDTIAKIFGIGIVLCVADMVLTKSDKKDVAFWLGLAGIVFIMFIVVPMIGRIFNEVKTIFSIF
jgi:stage III sporulation protein AC